MKCVGKVTSAHFCWQYEVWTQRVGKVTSAHFTLLHFSEIAQTQNLINGKKACEPHQPDMVPWAKMATVTEVAAVLHTSLRWRYGITDQKNDTRNATRYRDRTRRKLLSARHLASRYMSELEDPKSTRQEIDTMRWYQLVISNWYQLIITKKGRTNRKNSGKISAARSTKTTRTLTIPGCN